MNPLVSVVLPVFNAKQYIGESISSILRQTYRNIELIVVDDGSTDGTSEIIDEFVAKDDRVRLIRRENRGLVFSLNEGLEAASGKYIARMDADDISCPSRIEKQVAYLERVRDVALLGVRVFNSKWFKFRFIGITGKKICTWSLVFRNKIGHPGVMFRAWLVKEEGLRYLDEYMYAEDFKLWVQMTRYGYVDILPDRLLYYRPHAESISRKNFEKQQRVDRKIITDNVLEKLKIDMRDHFDTPPATWVGVLCTRIAESDFYQAQSQEEKIAIQKALQDYLPIHGFYALKMYFRSFGVSGFRMGGWLSLSFLYRSLRHSLFPPSSGYYLAR